MRRKFKPSLRRPGDFDLFWNSTRLQLERVEPEIERAPFEPSESPLLEAELITFTSLGRARITAYLLHWRDGEERPLIVHSHGYIVRESNRVFS